MQPDKVTELKVIWRERVGWAARQVIESNVYTQISFERTAVCHQKKVIFQ
jgi:hypothetical protein